MPCASLTLGVLSIHPPVYCRHTRKDQSKVGGCSNSDAPSHVRCVVNALQVQTQTARRVVEYPSLPPASSSTFRKPLPYVWSQTVSVLVERAQLGCRRRWCCLLPRPPTTARRPMNAAHMYVHTCNCNSLRVLACLLAVYLASHLRRNNSIVNEDRRIVGIGYNGFPMGCSDDDLPWARQAEDELDTKYPVRAAPPSRPLVLHHHPGFFSEGCFCLGSRHWFMGSCPRSAYSMYYCPALL